MEHRGSLRDEMERLPSGLPEHDKTKNNKNTRSHTPEIDDDEPGSRSGPSE